MSKNQYSLILGKGFNRRPDLWGNLMAKELCRLYHYRCDEAFYKDGEKIFH